MQINKQSNTQSLPYIWHKGTRRMDHSRIFVSLHLNKIKGALISQNDFYYTRVPGLWYRTYETSGSPLRFMLRRSSLVECVTRNVFTKRRIIFYSLLCPAMFVNESEQNEHSLQRTFQGCFLPSFGSFDKAASEDKIFQKSTNQKQKLSVAPMFDNGSGRNEHSLQRTCHRCFIPSFSSFGQAVSEEKI